MRLHELWQHMSGQSVLWAIELNSCQLGELKDIWRIFHPHAKAHKVSINPMLAFGTIYDLTGAFLLVFRRMLPEYI